MKSKLFSLCFALCALSAFSQKNYWRPVSESDASKLNKGSVFFKDGFQPASFKLFSLNENELAGALTSSAKNNSATIIAVPVANGNIERFSIKETTVMEPALQAKYSSIKTYIGQGVDNPSRTITCSYNKLGFFASIRSIDEKTMYLNPVNKTSGLYAVFARNENDKSANKLQCQTDEFLSTQKASSNKVAPSGNVDDGTLRTFRLALCTTGEWSLVFVQPTDNTRADSIGSVLAALAVDLARANQVYETDLGIHMNFVANEDTIIFLNPSTDPFSLFTLNNKCQKTCDSYIGNANYDIGHVVAKGANNGNAGCIGCVCQTGAKGSGMSTYSQPTLTDYFVIDYWTHEMGHQYGANHTFTFNIEGTNAQIEPGSGSTIMGYAGITGNTDVQAHSDDLFSTASIAQISNYIKPGGNGNTCAVSKSTGNHAPIARAGGNRIIPMLTPFILTGAANDVDRSDSLSFIWEQTDAYESGSNTFPRAAVKTGPEFRTYNYTASKAREFPDAATVLKGDSASKWESLSSVNRQLNFRFTVRDNHVGSGNNKSDDVLVTVTNTSGPFVVTSPNTTIRWTAGSTRTITWNVANTTAAPVNCANVSIFLSTDGGLTFPIVLSASTPNNGSAQVIVPNIVTATARIGIFAVNNIFFDVSDANFRIVSAGSSIADSGVKDDATAAKKTIAAIVSPNPAKDFFNVTFNASAKNVVVILSDANGKTIFSKSLSSVMQGQSEKISVHGFAKGNYFLKINTEKGTQASTVLID